MTKPNTKHSSVFSGPTRQKAQSPIHKNLHSTTPDKLSEVSKISGSSPLHIQAMVRAHYIKNPQGLCNLAEAALTEIKQPSSQLDSISAALKNFEDALESVTASRNEAVTIDLSNSLEDLDIDELVLAIQSLDDDSSEQTILGQEAIDNTHITDN
jgi:hypothetical protein